MNLTCAALGHFLVRYGVGTSTDPDQTLWGPPTCTRCGHVDLEAKPLAESADFVRKLSDYLGLETENGMSATSDRLCL